MTQVLHQADEETDVGAYGAYLRAQTDADLLDIVRHLDPQQYPARLDAAEREARRRHVLQLPVYTAPEYVIRCAALAALALAAVTLALARLLTPELAAGPLWPDSEALHEGVPVSQILLLYTVSVLRGAVVWGVHLGLYAGAFVALGFWTLTRAVPLTRHRARADVWRLAALAWAALIAVVVLAAAPGSAVPALFAAPNGWPRALTLLDPFA